MMKNSFKSSRLSFYLITMSRSEMMKECWKDPVFREKMSRALRGRKMPLKSEETKNRHSLAAKEIMKNPEERKRRSETMKHQFNDDPSRRQQMLKRWEDPEYRQRQSDSHKEAWKDPVKVQAMMEKKDYSKTSGENHYNWQGGKSFEPYCPKFNDGLKEKIREQYDRKCYSCGKTEEDNGRRLDVHHIDEDKEQGCNGKDWKLIPLCISCHIMVHRGTLELMAGRHKFF